MLGFLGTLLLIYIIWRLLRPVLYSYVRRKYRERINDMFGQAFGNASGVNGSATRRRPGPPPRPQKKRKIYARDEGEYVEFEEIEVSAEFRHAESASDDKAYTPREPQVSDADWEDL